MKSIVLLANLLMVLPALASFTETIVSFSITSGDYLIDSDASRGATYDRDEIAVQASISFTSTGPGSVNYRCDYQLYDFNDNLVMLDDGAGNPVSSVTGSSFLVTASSGRVVFDRIKPAATLESGKLYYVRLLLKEQATPLVYATVAQEDTASKRIIHFTNTSSADAAVNVRSYIDSVQWVKRFACDTDPDNDRFVASATLKLHRYDAYLSASPTTDIVPHRITYELVEFPSGNVVAIAGNTTGPGYNMTQHVDTGGVEEPYIRTVTREFNIKPNVQLDPVNKSYYVLATLSHEEVPGEPHVTDHGPVDSVASTLLHYNGRVVSSDDGDEIIMTSIFNDPFAHGFTHFGTEISTMVGVADSHVAGFEDYAVDWHGSLYALMLQPDGTARYGFAAQLSIMTPASPDIGVTANVRFQREDMFFNKDGLQGNVKVILPTGLGAYLGPPNAPSNHVLESMLDTGTRSFTPELRPQAAVISIASPTPGHIWHVREESKPVEITCLNILWNLNTGEFAPGVPATGIDRCRYVRRFEMDYLAASALPAADKEIASNELFYNHVNPVPAATTTWATDADGVAEMNTTLAIDPGSFATHFPLDAKLEWASPGTLQIAADRVVPATSSLPAAAIVEMQYARDCAETCGTVGDATVKLDPGTAPFAFTRDGGLAIPGSYIASGSRRDIVIGYIDALSPNTSGNPVFTHDTTIFANGRFLMAGHHLDASDFSQAIQDGPGVLLNTGFDSANPDAPERPDQAAYIAGLGDYPGMNYRVAAETTAPTAVSILGGEATPTYALSSRSKYYTRRSGVSGIHEPAANPFTGPVLIYDYEFNFNSFGLSFLGSRVHDSITAGSLDIPHPSNFTLAFDPLFFDCLGGLTTAEIPGGSFDSTLEFWNAAFTGISAHFQPAIGADCDPSEANLVVGVRTHASNIAPALAGALGFHSDGNLITAADARLEGIDSRLNLPSVLEIAGPGNETYNFFPTHDAYFENHTHSSETRGRLSFAGLLDVPFFEDLEVHFQTGTTEGNTTDAIHMMAGWPGDGVVTAATFDPANRSYPASDTLTNYRNLANTAYRPRAIHDWLGVVTFDYLLDWDTTTRSFRASAPVENDLMVLTTEHELAYLSADSVELDFGASLDLEVPAINLSNIGIDLVENTGVLSAVETAISENVTAALIDGLDASAALLDDRMDAFFDRLFESRIDPIIDQLAAELATIPEGPGALAVRQAAVEDYLQTRVQSVQQALFAIDGAVGEAGTIIDEVDLALARLQIAIRTVIGRVEVSGGQVVLSTGEITVPEDAVITAGGILVEGLFADAEGDGYDLAQTLIGALIEQLAPDIAASLSSVLTTAAGGLAGQLEGELSALFAESGPTIERVKIVLVELHNTIQQIRDAGTFYSEISDAIFAATGNIEALLMAATDEVNGFLASITFEEYSSGEIKAAIRSAIRDKFSASPVIAAIQSTLKSYIYDLDAAISQAISSAFAEVNRIITRLLKNALPGDTSLANLLGDVSGIAAAGEIDGYARINGDALRTLRLDAALRLKLPDDFEFNGYLEINQLDSDGDSSCSFAGEGEYAAEVILGAVDVPVAWSGEGLRFDVETKFTFDTAANFRLRGFGGSFEMTQGEIGFESMAITSLAAAAMFGLDENYLAAQVGLRFESYRLEGGVFFGRTCSIDPLELVDPDVTKVLGRPPFTGIYAYGEAQIPIVNAGCFFNLSAKAGAGVFWFEEGNTYGGKMKVGATGRALCAVGVGGELTLVGSKSGNNYAFFGKGTVFGEVGKCKLCTRFQESVELTYKNNKWSYDF